MRKLRVISCLLLAVGLLFSIQPKEVTAQSCSCEWISIGYCQFIPRGTGGCPSGYEPKLTYCDDLAQACFCRCEPTSDPRIPCTTHQQCREDYADNQQFDEYKGCAKPILADAICTFIRPTPSPSPPTPSSPPVADCIPTAIGCIDVKSPEGFVNSILTLAIGLAGGIAMLLIIFGGIQILTSAGNPDKIQAGKELITSAIAGLILIVFSVFILRIIGVEILGIFK